VGRQDVRLVGENAGHRAAKVGAHLASVGLVGDVDKGRHRVRVQVIRIGVVVEPFAGAGDLPPQDEVRLPGPKWSRRSRVDPLQVAHERPVHTAGEQGEKALLCRGGRAVAYLDGDDLGAIGIAAGRHQSSGSAGGPTVLIVQPGTHALFARHAHCLADAVQPLRGHVDRFQPVARVHEKAAHAVGLHVANLAGQFIRLQPVVP